MKTLQLSILDFGYINPPNLHAYQTINSLLDEIGHYEKSGYKRLWLTEHYSPEFAWFNPEMLLPLLAGHTETIHIGLAGILLNYHFPLRVYQNFKLLGSLFPDRIDLGLASAKVPHDINKALTGNDKQPGWEVWPEKIEEFFNWKNNSFPEENTLKDLPVPPHGTGVPNIWFLGASQSSIPDAVKYKSNFSVSLIHTHDAAEKNIDTLRVFKEKYFEAHKKEAECSLVVSCKCNPNHSEKSTGHMDLEGGTNYIVDQLYRMAEKFNTNEIVIYDKTLDRSERFDNLMRLAEATNNVLI